MENTILKIESASRYFGGLKAVNNVSFEVEKNSIHALIGTNGAGKTTLFNLISGNLPLTSGTILFNDHDISEKMDFQIAKLGIARTFQTTKLFTHMSVFENIKIGRHSKSNSGFLSNILNLPGNWRDENELDSFVSRLLEDLKLFDLKDEIATELPFGKQRLVEIARALASEPDLLLLDEPAAGLNIYETNELAQLIQLIREQGVTVLIVEHDMSLVMDVSDQVVVMDRGEVFAQGVPQEIQKNEDVIKIYLGEE